MQFSNELLRKQCVKSKDEGQEIVCFSVTADNLLTVDSLQLPNDAQKTERYLERDAEGVCCVCMCAPPVIGAEGVGRGGDGSMYGTYWPGSLGE